MISQIRNEIETIEVMMQVGKPSPVHVVCDGTHIFVERITPSRKKIAKYTIAILDKLSDGQHQNPLRRMQKLPERFDFNKVKEATVDGHPCNQLLGLPRY